MSTASLSNFKRKSLMGLQIIVGNFIKKRNLLRLYSKEHLHNPVPFLSPPPTLPSRILRSSAANRCVVLKGGFLLSIARRWWGDRAGMPSCCTYTLDDMHISTQALTFNRSALHFIKVRASQNISRACMSNSDTSSM